MSSKSAILTAAEGTAEETAEAAEGMAEETEDATEETDDAASTIGSQP
jgi:hypothetical protein